MSRRAGENVEELGTDVLVRAELAVAFVREELGEVGVELAIGNEVSEAFEVIRGVGHAGLREADAGVAAVDAEEGLGLGLEEVVQVLREDHGDSREVAQGGDNAAGFQLRQKAGGEAGVAAELDETHGFFEPEVLDALADALLADDVFGGFAIDGDVAEVAWRLREGMGWGRWIGGFKGNS